MDIVNLELPLSNDIRQTTSITIDTMGEWQYLSSPNENWITGTASEFTFNRNQTSINGLFMITLGPNYPPEVSISQKALPWENQQFELIPIINDTAFSTHVCVWDIGGFADNKSLNLSLFEPDSNVNISVNCTDEGGLIGNWEGSILIDDEYPWINETNDSISINPGFFEWDIDIGDDNDENLEVYWTSNKSENWWAAGKNLQTTFHVNSALNSHHDSISERHMERNPVEYWLNAEIEDDAGHIISKNWTIQLLDSIGPTVSGQLEINDGENWINSGWYNATDNLRLNLTPTFDDHSAIENIVFEVKYYDGNIQTNMSWDQIQFLEISNPGIGYHIMEIKSWDEAGNIAISNVGIPISPNAERNLEISEIRHAGGEIKPGLNKYWITVKNYGAGTTDFILCSGDVCNPGTVGPANYLQNTTSIVQMEIDMGWFETFEVELSYLDENNETVVKMETTNYSSGTGIGGLELLLIAVTCTGIILWIRSRNEARF